MSIRFLDYCLFDSSTSRNMLQSYEMFYKDEKGQRIPNQYKFHALITTYEVIISDCELLSDIEWRVLIIDEAHRLKNAKCKLMEGLKMFDCVSWLNWSVYMDVICLVTSLGTWVLWWQNAHTCTCTSILLKIEKSYGTVHLCTLFCNNDFPKRNLNSIYSAPLIDKTWHNISWLVLVVLHKSVINFASELSLM